MKKVEKSEDLMKFNCNVNVIRFVQNTLKWRINAKKIDKNTTNQRTTNITKLKNRQVA